MRRFGIVVTVLLFSEFKTAAQDIKVKKVGCVCPPSNSPECGVDGGTYISSCERQCYGIPIWYKGPCIWKDPPSKGNSQHWFPRIVQGFLRKTVNTKANIVQKVFKNGQNQGCKCPRFYEPECGKNGKTYSNRCMRECHGFDLWHKGECTSQAPQSESNG